MHRLKIYRKDKNLTLKKLAQLIDLSESTISLYESGKRHPSIKVLRKLANVFNCTIDDLLDDDEKGNK